MAERVISKDKGEPQTGIIFDISEDKWAGYFKSPHNGIENTIDLQRKQQKTAKPPRKRTAPIPKKSESPPRKRLISPSPKSVEAIPSTTLLIHTEEIKLPPPVHSPALDITKFIQNGGKTLTPEEAYAERHTADFSAILDPNAPSPPRQVIVTTEADIKKVKDNFSGLASIPKIPKKQ